MAVNSQGDGDRRMSDAFGNHLDVFPILEQLRDVRVPEAVECNPLDLRPLSGCKPTTLEAGD